MGLFSTLGKVALTVAKGLDNVDTVNDITNLIPNKIEQGKEIIGKFKDFSRQYNNAKVDNLIKKIDELDTQLAISDAKSEGAEYENAIQISEEHLMPVKYAIPPQYDAMSHIGNNLFSVSINGKWGIIDINNRPVIPFEYDYIYAVDCDGSDDYIFPVEKNGKWGYINLKNEVAIDFIYEDAWNFTHSLASVAISSEESDAYGYINHQGEFVLPAIYDSAKPFNDQKCAVIGNRNNSGDILYGVINTEGSIVINCQYEKIHFEDDYIICVPKYYNCSFYDYSGVPLTPTEEMKQRNDQIEKEQKKLKHSVFYQKNKKIKDKIIPYFNSNFKYGYFIRTDNGLICKIEPIFDDAYYANDFGYARVQYNNLFGVIKLFEMEDK